MANLKFSAKELEHYRQVRETFESTSLNSPDDIQGTIKEPGPRAIRSHSKRKSTPTIEAPGHLRPNGKHSLRKDSKGKGKATKWDIDEAEDDDDDDDDDEEAYVTSSDYGGTPQKQQYHYANGSTMSTSTKGKGKEVATTSNFEDDEDDLYEG